MEYERVLLVKQEVFVYRIPPRSTSRGYRASDWKLDAPDWTGRLRVVAKEKECVLKLEDKNTGELFASCPVDKYPGVAIEAVLDSSRYFVLRIQDGNGRSAFIGIGFADRSDSFDLNVALQDHFKWLQKSEELENPAPDTTPPLDLSFKEGETITINMNITKKGGSARQRQKPGNSTGSGLLPPPPGGIRIPPPSGAKTPSSPKLMSPVNPVTSTSTKDSENSSASSLLLDLDAPPSVPKNNVVHPPTTAGGDLWGDFATAKGNEISQESNSKLNDWVQF